MSYIPFDQVFGNTLVAATEEHLMDAWRGDARRVYSSILQPPSADQPGDDARLAALHAREIWRQHDYPGWNIPRLTPDFGPNSLAAYWSGGDGLPLAHSIEEAEALPPPRPPEQGDAHRAALIYHDVCRCLETKPYDKLWTATIDIQSPLNVAAMLVEPDALIQSMTRMPDAAHRFMQRVTDHIIYVLDYSIRVAQGKVCGNARPAIWLPSDLGVVVTEGFMGHLPPALYSEFGIKYLEQINARFGGMFLDVEGSCKPQLMGLRDSSINLLGISYRHPDTTLEEIFSVFHDSILIVPQTIGRPGDNYTNRLMFLTDITRQAPEKARLWLTIYPEDKNFMMQMITVQAHVTQYQTVLL